MVWLGALSQPIFYVANANHLVGGSYQTVYVYGTRLDDCDFAVRYVGFGLCQFVLAVNAYVNARIAFSLKFVLAGRIALS